MLRSLTLLAALLLPSIAAAQVNLTARLAAGPLEAVAGGPLLVEGLIETDGTAVNGFRVAVRLATGGAIDDGSTIATLGPYNLAPNDQLSLSEVVTVPINVSGTYAIALVADPANQQAETNEFDNETVSPVSTRIRPRRADLDVTQVASDVGEGRADDTINVAYTVENLGEIAGAVTAAAYLSRDERITPDDALIGTENVTVQPAQTRNRSIAATVPSGQRVGDYYVGVIVDPANLVIETDEINNIGRSSALFNVFEEGVTLATTSVLDGILTVRYHLVLQAAGGTGHYTFTVSSGALPDGLALAEDGTLSGTPIRTGSFSFEVTVASGTWQATEAYAIDIVPTGQELTFITTDLAEGFTFLPYEQFIVIAGGEGPYSLQIDRAGGVLPPGLDLGSTGTLSGIPTTLGIYTFDIIVEDALGARTSARFTMRVRPRTNVIVLLTEDPELALGEPVDVQLQATGGVPPYAWEAASTPPPGVTLTEEGRLTGEPTRLGTWPFRVRVSDSTRRGASDTALIQVRVVEGGEFEIANESLPPGLVRSQYKVALETVGGQPPFEWRIRPGDDLPDDFFLQVNEEGQAEIIGFPFRPVAHAVTLEVDDSLGRRRARVFAIHIESAAGTSVEGCRCTGEGAPIGALGLLPLGLFFLLRRRRSR